ncbi:MAG: M35 family metallopeptidase [Granulosicoccus sp.]
MVRMLEPALADQIQTQRAKTRFSMAAAGVVLSSALVVFTSLGQSMAAEGSISILPSGVVPADKPGAQAPQAAEPLRMQMSPGSTPSSVVFELFNDSDQTIQLLRDGTPFDDVPAGDVLRIISADQRGIDPPQALYVGPVYRRLAPDASRFIDVPPSGSVRAEIDIASNYQVPSEGRFRIMYRGDMVYARTDSLQSRSRMPDNTTLWSPEVNAIELDLTVVPLPLLPRAQPPQFDNCTVQEQQTIVAATLRAETRANESVQDLQNTPEDRRPTSPRYTTWFGLYSAANYDTATTIMQRISSVLTDEVITYRCSPELCSSSSTVAYVQPFFREDINLCPLFFDSRLDDDFRTGTVIHELSHLVRIGNTDDLAYGAPASAALARNSAAEALTNADNHTLFAMNNQPPLPMISDGTEVAPVPEPPANDSPAAIEFTPLQGGQIARNENLPMDRVNAFRVSNVAALELTSLSGDADLYVWDSASLSDESLVCTSTFNSESSTLDSCQITNDSDHFVLVYGFVETSYELRAIVRSETGSTIAEGAIPLEIGERVTGSLNRQQARIYTAIMPGRVVLTTRSGDTDLYIFRNSTISEESEVCRSRLTTPQDFCELPGTGRVHIVAYGFTDGSSYELVVESLDAPPPTTPTTPTTPESTDPETPPNEGGTAGILTSNSGGGSLSLLALLAMTGLVLVRRPYWPAITTGKVR